MSNKKTKRVLIVAGEASGDLHGAGLVRAMRKLLPHIFVQGIGGMKMEEAGVKILVYSSEMAVVGLTEVFSKSYSIIRARRILKTLLKDSRPDLLILIDYPDFNIHMAGIAKGFGIPVLYYISPQVWAWRKRRIKKIAKRVDRMAVILPFEKEFYLQNGADLDIEYVGHPLLDNIPCNIDPSEIKRELGLTDKYPILGLLPGSRDDEVRNLLPSMVGAVEILSSRYHSLKCLLPMAPTVSPDLVRSLLNRSSLEIMVSSEDIYKLLSVSHFALVASGTATLEAAIMQVPMAILYRISRISFWLGKVFIKVPHIGLVNLIAGKMIVPEFIQDEVTPRGLAEEVLIILEDERKKRHVMRELEMVKKRLGSGGASEKAAKIAVEMLGNN